MRDKCPNKAQNQEPEAVSHAQTDEAVSRLVMQLHSFVKVASLPHDVIASAQQAITNCVDLLTLFANETQQLLANKQAKYSDAGVAFKPYNNVSTAVPFVKQDVVINFLYDIVTCVNELKNVCDDELLANPLLVDILKQCADLAVMKQKLQQRRDFFKNAKDKHLSDPSVLARRTTAAADLDTQLNNVKKHASVLQQIKNAHARTSGSNTTPSSVSTKIAASSSLQDFVL